MQGYSRRGVYNKDLKAKAIKVEVKKKTDWVNLFLFGMLIVVLVLFFVV